MISLVIERQIQQLEKSARQNSVTSIKNSYCNLVCMTFSQTRLQRVCKLGGIPFTHGEE